LPFNRPINQKEVHCGCFDFSEFKRDNEKSKRYIVKINIRIGEDYMWKDEYLTGIDYIDEQHKKLFFKIEELLNHMKSTDSERHTHIVNGIVFLKWYTLYHFIDEEAYQELVEYEDYPEHREQHLAFIDAILKYESQLIMSNFAEEHVESLVDTLIAWLVNHVMNSDQKIVREKNSAKKVKKVSGGREFADTFVNREVMQGYLNSLDGK
jgi:hemerythrin-like metal-binding protein